MEVIALDTSHPVGSVAFARDGVVAATRSFGREASHLAEIGQAVDQVLEAEGMAIGDVQRVAIVNGPGSFTGLRIGLSFAKGLHAGTGAQLAVLGTLELMALALHHEHETVAVMVDAHRKEVYGGVFSTDKGDATAPHHRTRAVVPPGAYAPDAFTDAIHAAGAQPGVFVGTGVARYSEQLARFSGAARISDPPAAYPSAPHLAQVAHLLAPVPDADIPELEPRYIRGSLAVRKPLRPIDP